MGPLAVADADMWKICHVEKILFSRELGQSQKVGGDNC